MERYKRIFKDEELNCSKIKEASISFNNTDNARDAIANVIYFLSKKVGYDQPAFTTNVCYALYSGICSHLQDEGITDEGILQKKAKEAMQKILANVKRFTI